MEPVQRADESRHRLGKGVFARDVSKLVPQDYSAMFLRPFERAFRQQNYRRDRSPGEWSGGHGTAEEIHFARDACLGARVGDAIASAQEELVHGYTYSGHPVACAVALKNLEILKRDRIVERVKKTIGRYFQRRVHETFADHPLIGEVRGVGMLAAMELVQDKKDRRGFPRPGLVGTICRDHCFANGLVMRAIRDTMVLAPPLIITEKQIDQLLQKARTCIDLTAKDLGIR